MRPYAGVHTRIRTSVRVRVMHKNESEEKGNARDRTANKTLARQKPIEVRNWPETSANSLFRMAIITSANVDNARRFAQFNSNIKNNPFDDRRRPAGP